jgi:ammonia channel protein AmtB
MAASGLDFTAIGHVVALLLGIGLSYRLPSTATWTPVRVALLIGGSAFGYFVVSGSSVVTTVAGVGGMLVALLAGRVSRSRDDNEPVPAPR